MLLAGWFFELLGGLQLFVPDNARLSSRANGILNSILFLLLVALITALAVPILTTR